MKRKAIAGLCVGFLALGALIGSFSDNFRNHWKDKVKPGMSGVHRLSDGSVIGADQVRNVKRSELIRYEVSTGPGRDDVIPIYDEGNGVTWYPDKKAGKIIQEYELTRDVNGFQVPKWIAGFDDPKEQGHVWTLIMPNQQGFNRTPFPNGNGQRFYFPQRTNNNVANQYFTRPQGN